MFKHLLTALSLIAFSTLTFAEKIQVMADRLKGEKGIIVYEGNVYLKTDKGKKLYCDRLKVFLDKSNKITKAVAIGHVRYYDPEYSAVCQRATYKPNENIVILEGNAVVKNDKGILKGDLIVYNLKTGDIQAKSSRRVFSVFETKETE
jgi:lipopolysaccharide transport protein LptA